ncbi:YegS/Rv2252/BmrU family lipid kinase [Nocardioides sp.]|uniref:diacylglycerol/lipid kinase family protein n=1 Tax=Nocardioides sp. TaxID=35761 RepID=UPI002621CAFF|nr:YegS/Rv2252/BmrU family lipid kinase [Nocardioides sp.]
MSRTYALLPGPHSGRRHRPEAVGIVAEALGGAGIATTVVQGVDAADTTARLRATVESGIDGVVVLGGDGMVNIAIQVLAESDVPLGIIPMGTGNDTARALGLPLKSIADAAAVVAAGRTRTIDLARSGERYFATVMAAGFDAAVNERANQMRWPRGQSRYSLAIVAVLAKFRPIPYTLELDGVTRRVDAMLVSIGNADSMGGGLKVTHGADLADGLLDVVLFTAVPRRELVRNYPKLYTGGHVTHPAYERHRVRRVTVAAPGVVAFADGERFGALPLTVEVAPAALRVFVR